MVAMKTILGFEQALGRKVLWNSSRRDMRDEFIQRLRIYPHGLAEANAYYSPQKTALLFGYFRDSSDVGQGLPGGWVFTCLSHDIIAHETARAILHGVHRRSIEPTGPDTLAFHEAFADIVALLQHFTTARVVAHQIASTRGRLQLDSLLTGLAGQFGQATRMGKSLRSGIDRPIDEATGRLKAPDPSLYSSAMEAHDRGSILVGAVFDTFLTIFEKRTADLMRLATGSSEPTGAELPRELAYRLAKEACHATALDRRGEGGAHAVDAEAVRHGVHFHVAERLRERHVAKRLAPAGARKTRSLPPRRCAFMRSNTEAAGGDGGIRKI